LDLDREDQRRQFTRRAIALLTGSIAEPDGGPLVLETIRSYLEEQVDEAEIVVGLMNLCTVLLIRLEKATGRDNLTELQDIARKYG
jgi:hypothetical protein